MTDTGAWIRELYYEGDVWCKVFTVDELRDSVRPGCRQASLIRQAELAHDRTALLKLMIEDLLSAQMKESSNWLIYHEGIWEVVDPALARSGARQLQSRSGCETSLKAMHWFVALEGPAYRLADPDYHAFALWQGDVCSLFFEAG